MIFRVLFISIIVIWYISNIIYIDNLGSLRQALPQNIISWLSIFLIISIISFSIFYLKRKIIITVPVICYSIGLLITFIDLMLSKQVSDNFWYWSGTIVGVLLYIAGLQIRKKWLIQSICIYYYIIIMLIQSLLTIYQFLFEADIFYFAEKMRSNGIFQQINILSINMATACLLSLTTLVISKFKLSSKRHEQYRIIAINILIFIFTLTMILLQSVTTWLCFIMSAFIFICLFYKKNKSRVSFSYFIIIISFFIGIYLIKLSPQFIDAEMINLFHLKQMIRFSITLFLEQPYDQWEQSLLLQDNYERTNIPFMSPQYYITPHLHNKILLWIVSGESINLIFISLLLTGGIYVLFQSFIKYKKNENGYSLALVLSIIPMLIYSNVEYPFLLSVLHWGIIILFISFSDTSFPLKNQLIFYINKKTSSLFGFVFFIIGISIFILGLFLFNGNESFYTHTSIKNEIKHQTTLALANN